MEKINKSANFSNQPSLHTCLRKEPRGVPPHPLFLLFPAERADLTGHLRHGRLPLLEEVHLILQLLLLGVQLGLLRAVHFLQILELGMQLKQPDSSHTQYSTPLGHLLTLSPPSQPP